MNAAVETLATPDEHVRLTDARAGLLNAVREMTPLIESEAERDEAQGNVTDAVVDAMEEVVKVVAVKARPGYSGPIADNAVFREQLAHDDAALRAAMALIQSTYAEAQRAVAAGEKLTFAQRHSYRQTAIWVHRTAADIVQFCFNWGAACAT